MPKRTKLDQNLDAVYGFNPSTLEDVDTAFFNYLNDDLNIFCDTNEGFHKVPVLFATAERSFQIKDNPSARQVNQEKSRERANLTAKKRFDQNTFPFDNKKVVYDTLYIPQPTYVEVSYEVKLIAEYQHQMNQMIEAFMGSFSTPVAFKITHNGHVYEAFGDETFSNEGNNSGLNTDERIFKSSTTITVLGYIIGADKNDKVPMVTVRESAAEVTIGRERVVLGDEPEFHAGRKDKYRR